MINFKYIYFLLFICISFNSFSQVINIEYTSNSLTGGACIGERHKITLSQNTYSRLDLFDYTTIEENVELTNTGYDDAGGYDDSRGAGGYDNAGGGGGYDNAGGNDGAGYEQ